MNNEASKMKHALLKSVLEGLERAVDKDELKESADPSTCDNIINSTINFLTMLVEQGWVRESVDGKQGEINARAKALIINLQKYCAAQK
jgi:hypothetical protein